MTPTRVLQRNTGNSLKEYVLRELRVECFESEISVPRSSLQYRRELNAE